MSFNRNFFQQSILWEFNETISIYDYPGDNNATSLLPTEQIFNSTQLSTILTTKQPCLTNCYAASKPTVVEGNYIAELVGPVAMLAIVLSIVFVIYFRYQQRLKTQKKNDKENSKVRRNTSTIVKMIF